MTARPPPARPHIGLNPSTYLSYSWAEEDAWDSGSDSESPSTNTQAGAAWARSSTASTTATSPKAVNVPRPSRNSSSSTLAFSYTHVTAPSSYPPKSDQESSTAKPSKNGWTLVQKSGEQSSRPSVESKESGHLSKSQEGDVEEVHDVDGEMVVGDMDSDFAEPFATMKAMPISTVREDADEIVNDPLHLLRRQSTKPSRASSSYSPLRSRSRSPSPERDRPESPEKLRRDQSIRSNRRTKFIQCLSRKDVNMTELRSLAWQGVPDDIRPLAWQLLTGYLPLAAGARSSVLQRKRNEYHSLVDLTFARGREGLDQQIWHQIEIDVPRTRPGVPLWMHASTQRCLERILYVWAIRHPASGYVQGINDLVTPFFQVFLSAYIDSDPEYFDPSHLPPNVLSALEADSFWCLSRLLDGIQDNYIASQPGIQRSVKRMAELVSRIDLPLYEHLGSEGVEFMQFAFRWMNCLLMREISVKNTIRMWDTYLAEGTDAFSQFHLYVCSAFLVRWSTKLREMDFQGIIMFLQSLPTQDWTHHEIELLLSEAFVLSAHWQNAQSHFNAK